MTIASYTARLAARVTDEDEKMQPRSAPNALQADEMSKETKLCLNGNMLEVDSY